MTNRFINPVPQFLDGSGNPLISGKLYVYESGTNTLKNTFADVDLSIPNTNPVILGGDGRTPNIFFQGSAKIILTDDDDVQIWERDPVSAEEIGGAFSDWTATFTYSTGDIVQGSDGNYYQSITNNNQGNDPTISPANWEEIEFIRVWNTNVTYAIGDIVKASDNFFYRSKTNSNQGNDPTTDTTNWGSPFAEVPSFESSYTDLGTKTTEAVALDWAADTLYEFTAAGDVTLSFSNVTSADTAGVQMVKIYNGGAHTITFPATVNWDNATAPTLASGSGFWSMLFFYTDDGGTNVGGKMIIDNVDEN